MIQSFMFLKQSINQLILIDFVYSILLGAASMILVVMYIMIHVVIDWFCLQYFAGCGFHDIGGYVPAG